ELALKPGGGGKGWGGGGGGGGGLPALRLAPARGAQGQRQFFHRHDLPAGPVADAAAEQYPRRDLGPVIRGVRRRHSSDRRGPRRDGGRGAAGRSRSLGRERAGGCRARRAVAAAAAAKHERTRARGKQVNPAATSGPA